MIETLQGEHSAPHALDSLVIFFRTAISVTLRVTSLGATRAEGFRVSEKDKGGDGRRG
jgi:hypothetical protein